jgi:hypothetical protein
MGIQPQGAAREEVKRYNDGEMVTREMIPGR